MATVKVFAHTGVTTAPVASSGGRYTTDSIPLVKQPYLARQTITPDTVTAQSTDADTAPAKTALFMVQIEVGKRVAIEVNPQNRSVAADANSPSYSGTVTIEAGPGWTLSIIEVS